MLDGVLEEEHRREHESDAGDPREEFDADQIFPVEGECGFRGRSGRWRRLGRWDVWWRWRVWRWRPLTLALSPEGRGDNNDFGLGCYRLRLRRHSLPAHLRDDPLQRAELEIGRAHV